MRTPVTGDIDHVQGDDERHAELEELAGQVEIPLQVGGVDDIDDHFRALIDQIVAGDKFLDRIGGHRVGAWKIGDGDPITLMIDMAFLVVDGYARIVADMLTGAGELVEESGLAGVGIARQGYDKFLSHFFLFALMAIE